MFDQPPANLPAVPSGEPKSTPPPIAQAPVMPTVAAPAPKPAEPADMFAGVEPAATPPARLTGNGIMPPAAPLASSLPADYLEEKQGFPVRRVVVGLVVVLVVAGGGYAGYIFRDQLLGAVTSPTEETVTDVTGDPLTTATIDDLPTNTDPISSAPVVATDASLDTDGDKLTDVKEAELGTNPNNPDTDGDELFDGEEVDLFRTNPVNKDTDGDTFPDGSEVKSGYNPNGPGRLFNVPNQ